ncbi:hypothetical protein BRD09_04405, partial [Halobacteriales archaeon SW_10_68_16]
VDGIEAEGLADGELQVDRTPVKGRLAKSTPELIVEKLATGGDSAVKEGAGDEAHDERDFYASLLEKF